MPKKTVEQLNQQIARLQQQVEEVKAREVADVVKRIKEAISYYSLTAVDLFGAGKQERPAAKKGKPASKRKAKTNTKAAANKAETPRKSVKKPAAKREAATAKFADGNGNTWSGRGRPPHWLTKAIASGKTKEDFAVARESAEAPASTT